MSDYNTTNTAEDRFLRESSVCASACRQLADWALAHFGDRTEPDAYRRLVHSLSVTGADFVCEKVYKDLETQGYRYRNEAILRMYERFYRDAARQYDARHTIAA